MGKKRKAPRKVWLVVRRRFPWDSTHNHRTQWDTPIQAFLSKGEAAQAVDRFAAFEPGDAVYFVQTLPISTEPVLMRSDGRTGSPFGKGQGAAKKVSIGKLAFTSEPITLAEFAAPGWEPWPKADPPPVFTSIEFFEGDPPKQGEIIPGDPVDPNTPRDGAEWERKVSGDPYIGVDNKWHGEETPEITLDDDGLFSRYPEAIPDLTEPNKPEDHVTGIPDPPTRFLFQSSSTRGIKANPGESF